jgi:hypothetical protein
VWKIEVLYNKKSMKKENRLKKEKLKSTYKEEIGKVELKETSGQ